MSICNIFLLFINCLLLVNATNTWVFGKLGSLRIVYTQLFGGDQIYLYNCRYHKDRSKVYCDFENEKYRNKELYVMIPLWGDTFNDNDVINSLEIIDQYGEYAANGCVCVTSLWETIEKGDTYTPCSGISPSNGKEIAGF